MLELLSRLAFAAMLLLATTSLASADGLSYRLAAGLLVSNLADNQNARGHATIGSLNDKPGAVTRAFPFPLIELRYARKGDSIYFGSPVDEPLGLNLGFRRQLDKGAFNSSVFFSSFGREWQNPYLVGTPRSETRVNTYGGRVVFEDIGGTPMTLAVKGAVKNIVDERLSGDLRRDGARLDVDLNWRQRLGEGWTIVPMVGYQRGEYQGAVNNFHGASLGLGAERQSGDLTVTTRLNGHLAYYDRLHPVFNANRRDRGYRFSCLARLNNPFNWQHYSISAGVFQQQADSSIEFFTTRALSGFAAIGYQF